MKIKTALLLGISLGLYFGLLFLLVYVESASSASGIKTVFDALWYSIVTLTTVGYGDISPVTPWGKLVSIIFIISSLGVLGYLVSKTSEYFTYIREKKKMGLNGTDYEGHIVLIGWNGFSRLVAEELLHAEKKVAVVIDKMEILERIQEMYGKTFYLLFSDYRNFETLKKAGITRSAAVFINFENDTEELVYILDLKKTFPGLKYVVMVENSELKSTFESAGAAFAVSRNEITSKLVASYIFEPDVAWFGEQLLTSSREDEEHNLHEFEVVAGNPFLNRDYQDAFFDFKKQFNAILVGITKKLEGQWKIFKTPEDSVQIEKGDFLILIANGKASRKLTKAFGVEEGALSRSVSPSN